MPVSATVVRIYPRAKVGYVQNDSGIRRFRFDQISAYVEGCSNLDLVQFGPQGLVEGTDVLVEITDDFDLVSISPKEAT